MRTPDGYRFGLQFKASSDVQRQVGEYLESLGNKKSETIVTAMVEYIQRHPEVLNKDNPVKAIVTLGYSEEALLAKIEAVVRKIVGTGVSFPEIPALSNSEETSDVDALDRLLSSLDQF